MTDASSLPLLPNEHDYFPVRMESCGGQIATIRTQNVQVGLHWGVSYILFCTGATTAQFALIDTTLLVSRAPMKPEV